jgi:hypothetical protein
MRPIKVRHAAVGPVIKLIAEYGARINPSRSDRAAEALSIDLAKVYEARMVAAGKEVIAEVRTKGERKTSLL